MRTLLIAMLLCLPLAALAQPEAQALEDQGRDLLALQRFDAALAKFTAANQLETTPERLLAIGRCHRELAYQSAREAAKLKPTEAVIRNLAQSLDDLNGQSPAPPDLLPEPLVRTPPRLEPIEKPAIRAAPQVEVVEKKAPPVKATFSRQRLIFAAAAGTVAMLAVSAGAYQHASSLANGLSDPMVADKPGLQSSVNAWQTGSHMLLGAGLFLGAVTAGLLAVRF